VPTIKLRKDIRALHRRKGRERQKKCLIEGERSVASALTAGADIAFLVHSESFRNHTLLDAARGAGIEMHEVDDDEMQYLSDVSTPPGVLAVAATPFIGSEVLGKSDSVLVLDAIQDPGNAGTLIRTASWFGVEGVLALTGTVDLSAPKVIRASMGGIWGVKLAQTDSFENWLNQWRSAHGDVVAADLSGGSFHSWVPARKTALIVGGEANGLSTSVRNFVNSFILIPGCGEGNGTESLNAAVAGGILIARWRSQSTG